MAAASPRPSSPGGLSGGPAAAYTRWPVVKVRTLLRYFATLSIGGIILFCVVSFNQQFLRDHIYSDGSTAETFTRRELRELYSRRREAVNEVCYRNGINTKKQELLPYNFRSIYVDDKHKFLWCSVPKVACTNFKRVVLVLSGKVNTTDPVKLVSSDVHGKLERHMKTLDQYKPHEIRQRIRDYYKFMFVREPLERILSAYVNKFTLNYNKRFHVRYGTRIIKKVRKNPSKQSLMFGDDVTFEEFVKYLLDPSVEEPFNAHWLHYYKLCLPCLVRYDTIGKYETINTDVNFVLEDLGVSHLVKFPNAGTASNGKGKTSQIVSSYFRNISSEMVHQLWELYSVDYSMFGYPYPEVKSGDN